jgi:hypothetical protein
MASIIEGIRNFRAFIFRWAKFGPVEAQLAPKMFGIRGGHGWDRRLDRVSSGIYERAVRLHRKELRQMARRIHLLDLREKLAD